MKFATLTAVAVSLTSVCAHRLPTDWPTTTEEFETKPFTFSKVWPTAFPTAFPTHEPFHFPSGFHFPTGFHFPNSTRPHPTGFPGGGWGHDNPDHGDHGKHKGWDKGHGGDKGKHKGWDKGNGHQEGHH